MTHQTFSAAGPNSAQACAEKSTLLPMLADHFGAVEALHRDSFGPGRFARTAFRLREAASTMMECSFTAWDNQNLVGTVTMSHILIGAQRGALLGPLAVAEGKRDAGIGRALLQAATQSAFAAGHSFVLLVGDAPYYAPFGYAPVAFGFLQMPGPVDPARLLLARNPGASAPIPMGKVCGLLVEERL